jgi:hypothetical protein
MLLLLPVGSEFRGYRFTPKIVSSYRLQQAEGHTSPQAVEAYGEEMV